ncbi:MAG: hypothetical protein LBH43_17245 [Treponema sp.]|jgi:hypothetical protein|nr:hypothetical protein [Treponema sp.]
MTEEEADALDELLTRTTPKVNPAVRGITREITALKGFKMMAVDDYSAEYITSKALATRQTPEEIIHELVARDLTNESIPVPN